MRLNRGRDMFYYYAAVRKHNGEMDFYGLGNSRVSVIFHLMRDEKVIILNLIELTEDEFKELKRMDAQYMNGPKLS